MSSSFENAKRRRNPPRNQTSSIFSSTSSDEEDSESINTSSTFFERETDPEFFPSSSEEEEEEQEDDIITVTLSRKEYPETTRHIEDAITAGHPAVLTINRTDAKNNRKQSLQGIPTVPEQDRDEYPPAMTEEGGAGADVRHISSSDNRGAGSSIKAQLSEYPNGTRFRIEITK